MDTTVDYIPAEFAVIEFSLSDGVKRVYHQIVNIKVETGYTREALEHSDMTHKLSFDAPEGEACYEAMYNKLMDFMKPSKESSGKLPPLYTMKKMKTIVPCLLERMTKAVNQDTDMFEVYSLEYLLGVFMLHLNEKLPECTNVAILAEAHLEKEAFTWTPNIECSVSLQ